VPFYLLVIWFCIAKIYTPEHDGKLYEVDDFGEGSYIQWKILFYQPWFCEFVPGGNPIA
jgi:hypothetical protein